MDKYYELFLTSDKIDLPEWHNLFCEISRLHGIFRTWKLYLIIEDNMLRFFIKANVKIPPILTSSSHFAMKNIDSIDIEKKFFERIQICFNSDENFGDIYDKFEARHNKVLKQIEIKFRYIPFIKYLTNTHLYFQGDNGRIQKYKSFLFIPSYHLMIDFSKYSRFFCRKDVGRRFLTINKSFHLFSPKNENENLLEVDAFPYYQEGKYLNLDSYDFEKHSLIVGASGTGKSKFLASFIKMVHDNFGDLYKIVMIDPHGAIEEEIGGLSDSFVVDMKEPESTVDILINSKENANVNTEMLLNTFKNILAEQYNSKLERVLRHSLYLLLKKEMLTFNNLGRLITEVEFRNSLLKDTKDVEPNIISFFYTDFNELKNQSYTEAISPIVSVIDEIQMLPGINSENENNKISDVIQDNFFTLFSLNQAELGEKVIKIVSNLLLGNIFQLVQKKYFDKHIIFIIDEFAIIQNPILSKLLSEARKYNLSMFLVEQYLSQVSEDIQNSIYSNVMNYYCFRVAREDARFLANTLLMELSTKDSIFQKVKLLTSLSNRKLVVRVTKDDKIIPAFECRTLDFKKIPRAKNILKSIKDTSKKIIKKFTFELGKVMNVKEIMKSQSTSRKKKRNVDFGIRNIENE
ncbi:MAG: type IV secretion system DNA-binding domain-containing protein [Clostridia bacterium]|nr:type IV secretion system DNA-binding domain-containing protein [Clostridia bacterium]